MKTLLCPAIISGVIAWVCLTAATDAFPQGNVPGYPYSVEAYDAREIAMLPSYCIYTQLFRERVPGGNNPAAHSHWAQVMGKTFYAMHHYCWGLMKTNRALFLARGQQTKEFYLAAAIQEFDYVLENATPDFILLPEILTKKGENLIRLGRTAPGIQELQHAIEIKRDYWPPYGSLSDYYKNAGNIDQAREWLQRGLAEAPGAKALQRRLNELNGQKPSRSAQDRHRSAAQ